MGENVLSQQVAEDLDRLVARDRRLYAELFGARRGHRPDHDT